MRILLIQPPLDISTSQLSSLGLAEPLGLEYLAAALCNHEVQILDLRVKGSLAKAIEDFDPEVVGCTALTASIGYALEILKNTKAINPSIKTVIGGLHATLLPEDCQVDCVDVIVRGEGEETIAELVAKLEANESLDTVAGISYRDGDRWRTNAPRTLPPLDDYKVPARHLTEHYRHAYSRVGLGPLVSMLTSRGCTKKCTFCSVWRFHSGKYRMRSVESVVDEIASRPEMTVDFPEDDSFGNLKRMDQLADLIQERVPGRSYKAMVRAELVVKAPELFAKWGEVGMRYALIGLESFRDDELLDLNKTATAKQNVEALQILKKAGIGVIGYLIVRPDFQLDDFKRLGETVEEMNIEQPIFTTLTPFPGTLLYEQNKDRLITNKWEYFDAIHAVLPTTLPPEEYYHQLANLYRRAYTKQSISSQANPWYEKLAQHIERIAQEQPQNPN